MSSSSPNWVDLPPELWAAISGKHLSSVPDYLSFRGVCHLWRSIATFHNFDTAIPRLPWLMYVSKEGKKGREFANLLDLSANKVHKTINFYPGDGRGFLSSQGWILCVSDGEVYLTHPTSRARIELPGSDTFPEGRFIGKMVLSCNPADDDDDDLVVMVIWPVGKYSKMRLGFSRPGDSSWTVMDGLFADFLYHNGKLYAVDDSDDEAITVVGCDIIHGRPKELRHHVFSLPCSASGLQACMAAGDAVRAAPGFVVNDDDDDLEFDDIVSLSIFFEKKYYLLESCGNLIIVIRHIDYNTSFWFEVFEFDLKNGTHREINKHNLWNKTLFLGFDSSVCVDLVSDVVKPNCIYFTDDHVRWKTSKPFDMGVFCLSTGLTNWGFFNAFSVSDFLIPPSWIMPTFF